MDKIILYLTLNLAVFSQRPLIALVHATTITYYALEILYNKYNGISYPNEMDNAYDNLNAYMIFDLFYLFTEKQFRFDMMFHHLFTMGLIYKSKIYPQFNEFAAFIIFSYEVSTIFLQARKLTSKVRLIIFYNIMFTLTFFIGRFPLFFYYCYQRYDYIKEVPIEAKIFLSFLSILSIIWMRRIIMIIKNKINKKESNDE